MNQQTLRTAAVHGFLFLITLATTIIAGTEHVTGRFFIGWGWIPPEGLVRWEDLGRGIPYALLFLSFLSFHEFGHYFTARYHKVACTLPFYIPVYIPLPGAINIGSFGAVIRLKERPSSTRKYFDIGIAGPLAGFVVSLGILIYGFLHLPPMEEYVLTIHPEYLETFQGVPSEAAMTEYLQEKGIQNYLIGTSLLFEILKETIPPDPAQVPPHFELMHYPYLFVGYLTLFFTALNLLPIGQLDGGHVVYGLVGRKYSYWIARLAVLALLMIGGTGVIDLRQAGDLSSLGSFLLRAGIYIAFILHLLRRAFIQFSLGTQWGITLGVILAQVLLKWSFPTLDMNFIWLFYAFLVVRFVGIDHPPAMYEHRVNRPRQILGWLAILIFILCFSPTPLKVIG